VRLLRCCDSLRERDGNRTLVAPVTSVTHSPALPRDMRTHPVGTGPFKLVEFKPNEYIKVTRNPDYWKKSRPLLDGIEYTIIKNLSTAVLAFVSWKRHGEIAAAINFVVGSISPYCGHCSRCTAAEFRRLPPPARDIPEWGGRFEHLKTNSVGSYRYRSLGP